MGFKILIDSREQLPFFLDRIGDPNFPGLQIEFLGLQTGDYSLEGMSDPSCLHSVVVERKSISDLFQSTGKGRARFEREYARMSKFDHAALIVEADLKTVFNNPPPLSQMLPKSVFRSILAWSQRYGVHPWFCPNRQFAEKTTFLLLQRFWLDRQKDDAIRFKKL